MQNLAGDKLMVPLLREADKRAQCCSLAIDRETLQRQWKTIAACTTRGGYSVHASHQFTTLCCYCLEQHQVGSTAKTYTYDGLSAKHNYPPKKNGNADPQCTSQMVANYIICTYRKSAVKTFELVERMTLGR